MFYYSTTLTLIVLGSFPFYIGISVFAAPLFRRRLDEKFNRGSENQAFLVESVTGVETLKAMAVEPQMQRRWEEQLAGYVSASFRVLSLNNTASQAVQMINKLVVAATLYFGARLVIGGDLTVGELVAFNMLAARVSMPVLRLAQIWQDFHQARLSVDRLGDILNTIPEPSFSPGRAALPPIRGQVTFDHATFRYRIDGPEVLHNVSFSVQPGHVVGIVGSSSSGNNTTSTPTHYRPAHLPPRRAHQRARLRKRACHPADHEANCRRPDRVRDRSSALDRAQCEPDHHAPAWPHRRGRPPR